MTVVIVGAGPAGMTLAWLLVKNDIQVKIIERHVDFSREFRGEGIQESVVKHLEDLGLLKTIMSKKIGAEAAAARVFFDEIPVAVLKGTKSDSDFGIILHQEKFLSYLHEELLQSDLYTSYLGHTAVNFEEINSQIRGVITKDNSKETHNVCGDLFVITTGRGTSLRKKFNLKVHKVDTYWNILWLLLPKPTNEDIIPKGFRAYLNGKTLFIMYTTAEGKIQMAWSKKEEKDLKLKDFNTKKAVLLKEIPQPYKELIEKGYLDTTRTQFLKVSCDRLEKWHHKNVLFLGDAAHTMSPVAGQGINLAIRDSIVTANHLIDAFKFGKVNYPKIFTSIQEERIKEVKIMQSFQRKFGYFMLGAPRLFSKLFFFILLPILGKIGVQKKMLKMVQGGVSKVNFKHKK